MTEYYHIFKALHIISIISWMAGLLYLPRIFVYHVMHPENSTVFLIMERKLLNFIMMPAMISSYIFGILLIYVIGFENFGKWLHIKLSLVMVMTASHIMMIKYYNDFKAGINDKGHKFFRIFNEIPTILMIGIVFLAVTKTY